jgi:hypothetical protein
MELVTLSFASHDVWYEPSVRFHSAASTDILKAVAVNIAFKSIYLLPTVLVVTEHPAHYTTV